MFYKSLCATGWYFLAIEIESIAMIISKRYFVLSDKFLIAPKNSYRQAILTKKMLSTNLKTVFFSRKQGATCRHRALLVASLGLFIVGCRRCREQNLKQKLLESTLLWKAQRPAPFVKRCFKALYEKTYDHRARNLLRICSF